MYLKVNDGQKDYYYQFSDNKKVTVGRGASNDISVTAEGVSRNHLEIHSNNGEYLIVDLGATNGSFINEEKLEPKAKVPFNTFFPVQMGFHAKIYLVDESEDTKSLDKLVEETKESLEG